MLVSPFERFCQKLHLSAPLLVDFWSRLYAKREAQPPVSSDWRVESRQLTWFVVEFDLQESRFCVYLGEHFGTWHWWYHFFHRWNWVVFSSDGFVEIFGVRTDSQLSIPHNRDHRTNPVGGLCHFGNVAISFHLFQFRTYLRWQCFGWRLGPCTTGVTVGSILIEYVPGSVPAFFSVPGTCQACWWLRVFFQSGLAVRWLALITTSFDRHEPRSTGHPRTCSCNVCRVWRSLPLWLGDVCTTWICERSSLLVYHTFPPPCGHSPFYGTSPRNVPSCNSNFIYCLSWGNVHDCDHTRISCICYLNASLSFWSRAAWTGTEGLLYERRSAFDLAVFTSSMPMARMLSCDVS